ncbi:MAG: hypothetical protein RLZZ303_3481 [Candidatus Hydrogenedentota bacterium]|jgi:predicted nucleotidyltransferase
MDTTAKLAMPLPLDELAAFCKKWRIVKLSVFGSILRDDFHPDSDVDFLAEFEEGAKRGFLDEFAMEEELESLVGRQVDIVDARLVRSSRNPYRRQEILGTAENLVDATL